MEIDIISDLGTENLKFDLHNDLSVNTLTKKILYWILFIFLLSTVISLFFPFFIVTQILSVLLVTMTIIVKIYNNNLNKNQSEYDHIIFDSIKDKVILDKLELILSKSTLEYSIIESSVVESECLGIIKIKSANKVYLIKMEGKDVKKITEVFNKFKFKIKYNRKLRI